MKNSTGGDSDLNFAVGRAIAWCALGYSVGRGMGPMFEQDLGRCVGKVFVIWGFGRGMSPNGGGGMRDSL